MIAARAPHTLMTGAHRFSFSSTHFFGRADIEVNVGIGRRSALPLALEPRAAQRGHRDERDRDGRAICT